MNEWGPLFDDAIRREAAQAMAEWMDRDPQGAVTTAREATAPFFTAWVHLEGPCGVTLILIFPGRMAEQIALRTRGGAGTPECKEVRAVVVEVADDLAIRISKHLGPRMKASKSLVSLEAGGNVFLPTAKRIADASFRIGEDAFRFVLIEGGGCDLEDEKGVLRVNGRWNRRSRGRSEEVES